MSSDVTEPLADSVEVSGQNTATEYSTNFLFVQGWREYPDQFRRHARCFFKRFKTPTPCACNYDKPGMQVCIAISDGFEGRESFEIDLVGEVPNGTWVKLHQYGLPKEIESVLRLIPGLLALWETACGENKKANSVGRGTKEQSALPVNPNSF